MIELLKAALFGVIEAITEWLPISSTGHMILLDKIIKLNVSDEFYSMFEVVIQLGAILAVIILFFNKLWPFGKEKPKEQKIKTWTLWFKVVVAVIPSALVGLLLDDWFDEHLYNHVVVAITLILYGVAFILVEQKTRGKKQIRKVDDIDYLTAFKIGLFQVLSLVPGTSRSGSTILGAMLIGTSRTAAAEFSFFLAIPTMAGASFLKIVKFIIRGAEMLPLYWGIMIVGCAVSFFLSLVVIRGLMNYVKKHSFAVFGLYRIVLGVIVILSLLF